MAAPQSSPDLSVVSPEESASEGVRRTPGAAGQPPAGGSKAPSPGPSPATSEVRPAETKRRLGVPIWAVLLLAVAGAYLWASQYQRAEALGAQVVSLTAELEHAGNQLDAYKGHLALVRTGVGDLSAQVGALEALVNRDPLAPAEPAEAAVTPPAAALEAAPAGEQAAPAELSGRDGEAVAPFVYESYEGALGGRADEGGAEAFSTPAVAPAEEAGAQAGPIDEAPADDLFAPVEALEPARESIYSLDPPPFNSALYHDKAVF